MAALDLMGRRWALRILWELRSGPHTFRGLGDACDGISPAVLNTRLRELRDARWIERTEDGYDLTSIGAEIGKALVPLESWSRRWARSLDR